MCRNGVGKMPKEAYFAGSGSDFAQMSQDRRTHNALRAAQMYYLQDMTMNAIARELRVSRSSVSRLLSLARGTGLVEIRVNNPLERAPLLEQRINEIFGVDAHVVPIAATANPTEVLESVAIQAARTIGPLISSDSVIGVAWGSTIHAVSRHLNRKPTQGCTVVQLNGAGNTQTSGISYATDILHRFSEAYGARAEQFPVPAFFDNPETKTAMWKERSVRRILDLQDNMSIAIFGVGSTDSRVPSHVYAGGYLEEKDLAVLNREGAVGDVATKFFRADGSSDGISINDRSTGPNAKRLQRVPQRVCVVSGDTKVPGLRGALAGGMVTDLILDEVTAAQLIGGAAHA